MHLWSNVKQISKIRNDLIRTESIKSNLLYDPFEYGKWNDGYKNWLQLKYLIYYIQLNWCDTTYYQLCDWFTARRKTKIQKQQIWNERLHCVLLLSWVEIKSFLSEDESKKKKKDWKQSYQ